MAVALLITFETSQADHIVTQLRAYKEREFDRNPPRGFISSSISEDGGKVIFRRSVHHPGSKKHRGWFSRIMSREDWNLTLRQVLGG